MSRRLEIELTSTLSDQEWTWRAAGARQPKGVIAASLLPTGAAIGDVLKVEAEFFVDGIEITSVVPSKGARREPDRLEVIGSGRSEGGGVTTSLQPKRGGRRDDDGGDRRDRRDRGPRQGGEGRDGARRDGPQRDGARRDGAPRDGARRDSRGRSGTAPERPAPPSKPKPKRLRPQRVHRNAALAALPEPQRPIAEQVLRGGVPGVRKAVDDQNAQNETDGRPKIDPAPLVQLAEELLPKLKTAEWHDRADAALAGVDELDLRDLRSVVVAADSAARTDETRQLAAQLREALAGRVDAEHQAWLAEIAEALGDGRTVRALRMSSRPPKAGALLPPEITSRLVEQANAALADDVAPQRWGTVLDAIAYSPIRTQVVPAGLPAKPGDELMATVTKLASRVPAIAAQFGIAAPEAPPARKRRGRSGRPTPPPPPAASPAPSGSASAPQSAPPAEPQGAALAAEPDTTPAAEGEPGVTHAAEPEAGPGVGTEVGAEAEAAPAAEPQTAPATDTEVVAEPEASVEPQAGADEEAVPAAEPETAPAASTDAEERPDDAG
jgi:hypothetical protein